jgi:flagellar protein FliT
MIDMDEAQIILTYKSILALTQKMLEAAQDNDWEKLSALGRECNQLTDTLVATPSRQVLSKELQIEKVAIIHQIFACDAKIREITEPGMARLQQLLPNTHKYIN